VSPDNWLLAVEVPAAAKVEIHARFRAAPPSRLFKLPANCGREVCLDAAITRDGRFLVVTADYAAEAPIRVLTSWTSAVNRSATGR
jgi:hypothetical protein